MGWQSPVEVMPWVGLYTVVASLICIIAMAADAIQAVWQWKLWFPNKYFTLNAATITLIAIAMKIPVDLATELSDPFKMTKIISIFFLVTMLANFLPSLGLIDGRELLMNVVALGILVITIVVNMGIQIYTLSSLIEVIPLIVPILWPFSVALTISSTRKKLEYRYKESQQLISSHHEKRFSSKELKLYVKKCWMMTETRNPQFVIACSPISCAFGVICPFLAFISGLNLRNTINFHEYGKYASSSDYKWSLVVILMVQCIGVLVGGIAPFFRCFTSIGHYNLSKKLSKNHLNVFRVEKHWIQRLQQWKRNHVHSHIPGRHLKIVVHYVKNTLLNLCITLHIAVLVICKIICLAPQTFMILLSCCWYFFKSFFKRFKKVSNMSNCDMSMEIEEYTRYVVQIEEEAKLSKRILRNTLHSISQLLKASEEKEPRNLMMLLEKSKGINGVLEFHNHQVQPLYPEEVHNCWSLVVVTLTAIVIAIPNIANDHLEVLVEGVREGLQIVRLIEECLNAHDELVNERKSARRVWKEVDVYRTWLQIDLQKKARNGKTSREILTWLGDEAEKTTKRFKSNRKSSIDHSPYKFILASSMYRISKTILMHFNEEEIWLNDEELLKWISTMIADVLSACFTNLPHVIKTKCHHTAIEKRGDNIWIAAQLLGKSKKILKILKARPIPNIDQDSMAYIDNWRLLPNSQLPVGGEIPDGACSQEIQQSSSSRNESRVTIF